MDLRQCDVLFDMCVQDEYLGSQAAAPCLNSESLIGNLKRLIAFARLTRQPMISCVDTRRSNQVDREFRHVSPDDNPENHKIGFSLLHDHCVVATDNFLCAPLDILQHTQQAIFSKCHRDPFTNPKLDRVLTEMPARRFVVFGVPVEYSLRMLVLGLLRRSRKVAMIHDACGYWSTSEATMVLRQLHVKGCEMLDTESFIQLTTGGRAVHTLRARVA